jgi:hypothetical protein
MAGLHHISHLRTVISPNSIPCSPQCTCWNWRANAWGCLTPRTSIHAKIHSNRTYYKCGCPCRDDFVLPWRWMSALLPCVNVSFCP